MGTGFVEGGYEVVRMPAVAAAVAEVVAVGLAGSKMTLSRVVRLVE
jgi:hypothetical protein